MTYRPPTWMIQLLLFKHAELVVSTAAAASAEWKTARAPCPAFGFISACTVPRGDLMRMINASSLLSSCGGRSGRFSAGSVGPGFRPSASAGNPDGGDVVTLSAGGTLGVDVVGRTGAAGSEGSERFFFCWLITATRPGAYHGVDCAKLYP